MILVTGATGVFGSHVAKELLRRGTSIKAASFDSALKIEEKIGQKVLTVTYNLDNPLSFDDLLDGIHSMYLVAPSGSHQFSEQIKPLLVKAKEKNIRNIVLTTVLGADANPGSSHFKAEEAVRSSGINYTIIRPNFIFQNFITYDLWAVKKGMIYLPTEKGQTSYNDIRDVAAAIAEVLLNAKEHYGQTYSITGSQALTHDQMAEIFTSVLGRHVKNINPTEHDYKDTLAKFGVPASSVDFLATLYSFIKKSYFKVVTNDFEKITGKKPITFEQFVTDYRDVFNED